MFRLRCFSWPIRQVQRRRSHWFSWSADGFLRSWNSSLGALANGSRRGLGIAVLCGVAAIGLGADTGLLTRLSSSGTNKIEQALLDVLKPAAAPDVRSDSIMPAGSGGQAFRSNLPVEGQFPSLDGAVAWLRILRL